MEMDRAGRRKDNYEAKALFITMVSVLAVFLADAAGIPLKTDGLETFIGTEKTYSAKVAAVEKKNGEKYNFTVELQWAEKKKVPAEKVLLTYYGKLEKPWTLWNCTIEFKSTLERAPGRRNPGCFDYDKHLKSRGIGAVARIKNFEITAEPDNPVDKFERRLISEKMKYVETLSEHSKGLISGILFGDVSFLDEEVYENFRNNGTAHVLAVSGLHVGILYGFLQKVLGRKQTKGKALAAAAVLLPSEPLRCGVLQ